MKMKTNNYLHASAMKITFVSVSALLLTLSGDHAQNQPDSSWTVIGSLATARRSHRDMLPSGKVLVAGGYGTGILGSAEP
jgi:hypothetical protein